MSLRIEFLTGEHKRVPAHVLFRGRFIPTQPLIQRMDTEKLTKLGIYRHVTRGGDAPMGYSDWELRDGVYSRGPAGTDTERQAETLRLWREDVSCTPAQGELAIERFGLIGKYDAWIQSADRSRNERIWIERADVWKRNDPVLMAGARALGVSDIGLDALFKMAVEL